MKTKIIQIQIFKLQILQINTARYNQHKTTTRSTFPRKIGGKRSAPSTKTEG
jgi:hypothetical protein